MLIAPLATPMVSFAGLAIMAISSARQAHAFVTPQSWTDALHVLLDLPALLACLISSTLIPQLNSVFPAPKFTGLAKPALFLSFAPNVRSDTFWDPLPMEPPAFLVDLSLVTVLNAHRALFAQIVTTVLVSHRPLPPSNAKNVHRFCLILPAKIVRIPPTA